MLDMLDDILKRMHDKGWSPYQVHTGEPSFSFVPRGPATILALEGTYLTLPTIPEPANLQMMGEALVSLLAAGVVPAVRHSEGILVLGPFTVTPDLILVEGNENISFTYRRFYESLGTLRSLRE